jgi:hypothetical protein
MSFESEFLPEQLISVQESYKNGKLHGKRQVWSENGQPLRQEFYLNGKLEGECKEWYPNGQLQVQQFHLNGRFEGECKIWHENGQLLERAFYRHGIHDGKYQDWDTNGRIIDQCFYQNGRLEGESKIWNEKGITKHRFHLLDKDRDFYANYEWKREYTHVFLNMRRRLYSQCSFPDFGVFIIPDLLKFSNII